MERNRRGDEEGETRKGCNIITADAAAILLHLWLNFPTRKTQKTQKKLRDDRSRRLLLSPTQAFLSQQKKMSKHRGFMVIPHDPSQ